MPRLLLACLLLALPGCLATQAVSLLIHDAYPPQVARVEGVREGHAHFAVIADEGAVQRHALPAADGTPLRVYSEVMDGGCGGIGMVVLYPPPRVRHDAFVGDVGHELPPIVDEPSPVARALFALLVGPALLVDIATFPLQLAGWAAIDF